MTRYERLVGLHCMTSNMIGEERHLSNCLLHYHQRVWHKEMAKLGLCFETITVNSVWSMAVGDDYLKQDAVAICSGLSRIIPAQAFVPEYLLLVNP